LKGVGAPVYVGTALEERSQTVLIVEQSAAIQVNGLSAGRPWLMCDLKGQPIAQQQRPVAFVLATCCQCTLELSHHTLGLLMTVTI